MPAIEVSSSPFQAEAGFVPSSLTQRLITLLALLVLECLAVAAAKHPWLHIQQPMAAPIVFFGALLFFARRQLRTARLAELPLSRPFLALHGLAAVLVAASTFYLLHGSIPDSLLTASLLTRAAITLWIASLALLPLSLAFTFFSPARLLRVLSTLRAPYAYASLCAIAAMLARSLVRLAWDAPHSRFGHFLQSATFAGVRALLRLAYPNVVADPATTLLGTSRFQVEVAGGCSGIEGLALVLVLTLAWLVFARRELRLARALWLVPAALGLMYALNLVRIAALIAIGNAGYGEVAQHGFHSEAGWILFNLVALGFLVTAQQLRFLRNDQVLDLSRHAATGANQAAIYLLPFLAILAASLLSQATSAGFEWLYPLRLVAALAVVWAYRAEYRRMDWRCSWLGPAAGVAVFALWLALHLWQAAHGAAHGGRTLGLALAALPPWQRVGWLAARIAAAVVTVPLAEELAFRGFLARRVSSADVEAVPYRSLTVLGLAVSSLAFGLLHGRMWIAGTLAGLIFALVARRRGSLGEAVAAHATANLLLAVVVLTRHDYGLW